MPVGALRLVTVNTYNENTTVYITVSFKDKDGVLAAPVSARYRLNDTTNGNQEIVAWTALTPADVVEIMVTATQNAINGNTVPQVMTMTIEGTYSADDKVTSQTQYKLIDLVYYP